MKKHPWQLRRFLILFILFVFGIQLFGVKLGTDSASAAKALPQQQAVTPFLYPPYPGSVGENSIFDHTIPTYSQNDQKIVSFTGYEANKDLSVVCPNDPPEPEDPPDCRGVYQSQSLGFRLSYNGHPGIDYDTDYLPIFAAADSDQVIYSGWKYPQDHRGGLGLYVHLQHPNGYETIYGHLSATAVSTYAAPGHAICDPACGTGGFLLAAHDFIAKDNPLDRDHLTHSALHGWEIVDNTARLCVMNLYLHGIGANGGDSPIHVADSLASHPKKYFNMVLTNPPFGKKSSVTFVTEEGEVRRESQTIVRDDFWTSTSNKQLNFVQHVRSILQQHGRAAIVVPDNVLFEGGAGEVVRRRLLNECDVHTLLRLPTGIFYAQGVKANVLFFDRKPASEKTWTEQLWIYDLRTNMNFTLKTNQLARQDLDEFVACYNPTNRPDRQTTWSDDNPDGRWRAFSYDELMARDKVNLDIFWLRDESLEESANLPDPDMLAREIVEELGAALEQFAGIVEELGEEGT